jgi:Phosphotransferase enzyme family
MMHLVEDAANASWLSTLTDRQPVVDHDGRSGARIETAQLSDGSRVYVKTVRVEDDVAGLLTGTATRELELFRTGVLDRLPDGVGTALVGVEVVDGDLVTVSRDLGGAMLGWDRVLTPEEVRRILDRVTAVHRAFADEPPPGLCPLPTRLALLGPANLDLAATANPELAGALRRGWELFADLVPADVAAAVLSAHADPGPLAAAMAAGGTTLTHGDFWLVNLALTDDQLIPLDWGLATLGPSSLDVVTFCVGGMSNVDLTRDQLLATAREACHDLVDDAAFAAAELWALLELGWNKALDVADHPDPAKRATERADLDFWVSRARAALESGAVV